MHGRERENRKRRTQSQDSGVGNSEGESNELGEQRVTTADSQNDQSTATDDFVPISPPKKPRLSQEEKMNTWKIIYHPGTLSSHVLPHKMDFLH